PPVDRGLGAGAGKPVAGERAATVAVISTATNGKQTAGETPPFFRRDRTAAQWRRSRRFARFQTNTETVANHILKATPYKS
ncbi:MAG TPA: hypothetical protein VF957_15655, partial [Bradyrhizobium sp.]